MCAYFVSYRSTDVVNKYTKEEEVRSDDDDDDDDMPHVDDDAERDEKEFQRLNILSRHLNLQSPVCDIIRDYQRLCRRLMKGASMVRRDVVGVLLWTIDATLLFI